MINHNIQVHGYLPFSRVRSFKLLPSYIGSEPSRPHRNTVVAWLDVSAVSDTLEDLRGRPESSTDGGRSEGKGNRHGSPPMSLQRNRTPQLLREHADQLPAERFGGMDV